MRKELKAEYEEKLTKLSGGETKMKEEFVEVKRGWINRFGDKSIAYVRKIGNTLAVVRECDNQVLFTGEGLDKYISYPIYTMYTGKDFGTGNFVLQVNFSDSTKIIHTWHDCLWELQELKGMDAEYAHLEADRLLCGLLNELGYTDITKAYGDIDKYYS